MPAVNIWSLIRFAALVLVGIGIGWTANGWRLGEDIAGKERAWAEERTTAATAALQADKQNREREQVLADAIAMIDADHTWEMRKAHEENDRLRGAVDAGAVRLRVAARCPDPDAAGLPRPAAGAGVDHGTGAELDPAARPAYFALRGGLNRKKAQLAACQRILAEDRAKDP